MLKNKDKRPINKRIGAWIDRGVEPNKIVARMTFVAIGSIALVVVTLQSIVFMMQHYSQFSLIAGGVLAAAFGVYAMKWLFTDGKLT